MVSYADYPHAMPPHDFDLYPSQDNYSDMMPSTSQSYLSSGFMDSTAFSTFETQHSAHAFVGQQQPQDYQYGYNNMSNQQLKNNFHHLTPSASPHSASHSFDMQPPNLSASSESGASVSSSAMGSPSLHQPQFQDPWNSLDAGLALDQNILKDGFLPEDFSAAALDFAGLAATDKLPGCVDPTLIQPFPSPMPFAASPYQEIRTTPSPHFPFVEQPPSPAPSHGSLRSQPNDSRRVKQSGSQSPYIHNAPFHPYWQGGRRPSVSSIHSRHSTHSRRSGSYELDDEAREKGLCPIPECGRVFKDLKAHMLTHQEERPEKCPILTCAFHTKGFARKYDKNRHTLTHYKGTMVCGFCPGSGSSAEKSFNRADVFKRHLTSVHGVEQTPPNSRKKSPQAGKKGFNVNQNAAGTCSTCSITFANAQDFYEHLDDCVLRVVQQADPSEAINQKLLTSVAEDQDVKETMDRHYLPNTVDLVAPTYEEDDEEEDDDDADDTNDGTYGSRTARSGKGSLKSKKDNQH